MLESDEDRLRSIKDVGGLLIRTSSGEFWAIFDRQYTSVSAGDLEIESRTPALTCRSSDVDGMTKDVVLTVGATDYRMLRAEPDSPAPGWTTLVLRA